MFRRVIDFIENLTLPTICEVCYKARMALFIALGGIATLALGWGVIPVALAVSAFIAFIIPALIDD